MATCACCACPNCGTYPTLNLTVTSSGCSCANVTAVPATCSVNFPAAGQIGWNEPVAYCSADGGIAIYCDGNVGPTYKRYFCTWGLVCTVEATVVTHHPFSLTFVFPAGACNPFCGSQITVVATPP